MAAYINDNAIDAELDYVANADKQTACVGQPLTYYEAVDPPAWTATTVKAVGDAVRPTTRVGRNFEATAIVGAGNTGATEPAWDTVIGNETVDGDVTWTARDAKGITENAALAAIDYTKANGDVSGRKLAIVQKPTINIHTSGTVDHVAKVDDELKELSVVNTATAQPLTAGGTVTFPAHDIIEARDPT